MQGMNNNGMDKEEREEKGGLTLEQFTDIVLAQVKTNIYSTAKKTEETASQASLCFCTLKEAYVHC